MLQIQYLIQLSHPLKSLWLTSGYCRIHFTKVPRSGTHPKIMWLVSKILLKCKFLKLVFFFPYSSRPLYLRYMQHPQKRFCGDLVLETAVIWSEGLERIRVSLYENFVSPRFVSTIKFIFCSLSKIVIILEAIHHHTPNILLH